MASTYIEVSGLWAKSTRVGEVWSAELNPAIVQKIRSGLEAAHGAKASLVVFPAKAGGNQKGPTHRLVIAIDGGVKVPEAVPEPPQPTRDTDPDW